MNGLTGYISTFIKVFIFAFLVVVFINGLDTFNWRLIIYPILISLFFAHTYVEKTEILKIESKEGFLIRLKQVIDEMYWKIIVEENNIIVVRPFFLSRINGERVLVIVLNDQVKLIGTKRHVNKLIEYLKES